MIARYLGLTISAERALADAFALVGLRHAVEPEMRNAARLHSNWCWQHVQALQKMVKHYGAARSTDGDRLRRALFRGRRSGSFGLTRDLHDLMTLAGAVHGCWSVLRQAACERRDRGLEAVCRDGDADTVRQIAWLETKLRQVSPQALAVPSQTTRELAASIPNLSDVGAIAYLVPGPVLRGLLPLAPVTTALIAGLAVVLGVGSVRAGRAYRSRR
jgi:hypothetical protein